MQSIKPSYFYILVATAAYSYLFYQQQAGINLFLFSLLMVVLVLLSNFTLLTRPTWLAAAAGTLLSGFFVFWWGNNLSLIANVLSLFLLAGISAHPRSSFFIALLNAAAASLASFFASLFVSGARSAAPPTPKSNFSKRLLLLTIPFITGIIFFLLYREANPIFKKMTDGINIDFISFEWLLFTAFGFLLMFGFFRQRLFVLLHKQDNNAPDTLQVITEESYLKTWLGRLLTARHEIFTGVILFALLNPLLLLMNGLDVYFVLIANKLPQGVSVAQYLHDGTGSLIFSILLAISILMFVFRGYLNFTGSNKLLKSLALVWIIQNIIMVFTTMQRNWWIIESSGITRRRIGVYFYLLLCVIGLVTVFIKVAGKKSNWFLFRKNAWAFYMVLIAACFVNWDAFIVRFNLNGLQSGRFTYIDKEYQSELGHGSLAILCKYYQQHKDSLPGSGNMFTPQVLKNMAGNYYYLRHEYGAMGWQSYCRSKQQNLVTVKNMVEQGQIQLPQPAKRR